MTTFRRATLRDSDTVAAVARASREHFLPFLPKLHSMEGDRKYYRHKVFGECEVWLAEDRGQVVGFCAFKAGWLEHLYLLPAHVGLSLGESLLNEAKDRNAILQLWVFRQNIRAISFYERNGFRRIGETDGRSNEEGLPDALYEWQEPARMSDRPENRPGSR